MKVLLKDILIDDRVRSDSGDIERLSVSLQRYGLIQPIVITRGNQLVAGYRRLAAAKHLDWTEIEVRYREDFTDKEGETFDLELEIEENVARKDLTWQEEAFAVRQFHDIKVGQEGPAGRHTEGWGLRDTADYLGASEASIRMFIKVADGLDEVPNLADARNMTSAWKELSKAQEKGLVAVLAEKVEEKAKTQSTSETFELVFGDSREALKTLPNESVDLVLMDPPYGKDLKMRSAEGPQAPNYQDNVDHVMEVVKEVVKECSRVLKPNRVMLVFFDFPQYNWVENVCRGEGFSVCAHPLIWHKLGGGGVLPNRSYYAMNYECILHCQKGSRDLGNPGTAGNVLPYDRVPIGTKIHHTEKPLDLLTFLIKQHSFPTELVADPFAGSASTLRASVNCGRKAWGCELNKEYYEKALVRLTGKVIEPEVADDFHDLVPGTSDWIKYWRANLEEQGEMMEFAQALKEAEE